MLKNGVLKYETAFHVLRALSVLCRLHHMNGFTVRGAIAEYSIYLDFVLPGHMAASYVVLHDVLGFTVYIESDHVLRILFFFADND